MPLTLAQALRLAQVCRSFVGERFPVTEVDVASVAQQSANSVCRVVVVNAETTHDASTSVHDRFWATTDGTYAPLEFEERCVSCCRQPILGDVVPSSVGEKPMVPLLIHLGVTDFGTGRASLELGSVRRPWQDGSAIQALSNPEGQHWAATLVSFRDAVLMFLSRRHVTRHSVSPPRRCDTPFSHRTAA